MAIQPNDCPAGSAHTLRFRGNIDEANATILTAFPKVNGEFPSGVADATPVGVRFLLADASDLADMEKRFPSHVYDDAQPAGAAPHAAVAATAVANVVSATEESIALKTWAQNLQIRVNVQGANITQIDLGAAVVVLDTDSSGLGGESGLPVVIIPMTFTNNNANDATSLIDIVFEIPRFGEPLMQGVQKRPLTGMIASGVAAPRAVGNGVATTAHTLDNSTEQNGGPYVDMINLFVSNGSGGALVLTFVVAGVSLTIDIADNTIVQIFEDAVFQNASNVAAVTITLSGSGAGLFFWGDFARVL